MSTGSLTDGLMSLSEFPATMKDARIQMLTELVRAGREYTTEEISAGYGVSHSTASKHAAWTAERHDDIVYDKPLKDKSNRTQNILRLKANAPRHQHGVER